MDENWPSNMIWPQILDERETSLSPSYHRRLAPGEVLIFATPSCITKKRDTRLCCISIGTPNFWLEITVIIKFRLFELKMGPFTRIHEL